MFVNFFISAMVEIPAISLIILLVKKFDLGRKKILMGTYFFCGVLNLVVALLQGISGDESGEEPWKTTIICLAMGGKFAIAGAYAVIYMFSTEQFPTCIKNSGLGKQRKSFLLTNFLAIV